MLPVGLAAGPVPGGAPRQWGHCATGRLGAGCGAAALRREARRALVLCCQTRRQPGLEQCWCCLHRHADPRLRGAEGVKVVPGGTRGNRVKAVYREMFSPLFVNEADAGIPHLPQVFSGSHKCY